MMTSLVQSRPDVFRGWQIIHQTGRGAEVEVRAAYQAGGVRSLVAPFFDDVGTVLRAGDLGVSRAGAGSVAEAQALALPTLFMPYPHHKDQHQRLNAVHLVEAGGAVIADDLIDGERNASTVGVMLCELMNDGEARDAMRGSLKALGPATGARAVADAVLGAPAPVS
jgi:UDP-N-acetylglucosamine--N-acetylmuramyl-(pentapeptide) pyrophosphoryl-undecaprenol N-acetylglucosamine transferase